MPPTTFNIKIYSDTCYIGLKTLEHSIHLFKTTYPIASHDIFSITWSPYYLNPFAPTPGILASTRIAQKNGAERAEGIKLRLSRVGRAHGINFTFSGKVGNTRDSHRLILLAGQKGEDVQGRVVEEFFRDHFEGEGDVSLRCDLVKAGVAAGLEAEEVGAWLDGDEGGEEVDREAGRARDSGVTSVPTFEINGKRLEGAEDPSAFYEMFAEIKAREQETSG
ncbi:thioredoxin-like protein [Aureobasidium subglaciale]|nr:thioredoxin-like protein [Aureobasidium subglaciale]KAI5225118.1 thioredoxin-like protein [Aureobasidium subglaciale]KAI5228649.1 thioredoxin-like protein [Aureobasidium subglaciale]KAI5263669.1 thioredoxin-like protein [Aureobasidium subglaciale]